MSRAVLVGSTALLLIGLGLHAVNLKRLHDDALLNAERTTRNLALAFAEHTARTFESADRALLAAVAAHTRLTAEPGDYLGAEAAHRALRDIQQLSNVVQSLGWTDAEGRLMASSAFTHPPPFRANDLEHFRVHDGPEDIGLFIGRPFLTQLSGAWVTPLSRRLSLPGGGFDGIAIALLDLSYFGRLYNSMTIGQTQTIGLLRADGTFIMREPQVESAPGQSIADVPLFTRHLPAADHGTLVAQGRLDGLLRIISYAVTPGYPLIVTVGLAHDEALAEWRQQLLVTSATLVVFLAVLAFVAFLLIVQLERDEGRRRELDHARRDAEAANKAKSDFLSNMSHELRTPLNAILGYAEVIRDQHLGARHEEMHRAYAGNIHAAGTHLLTLINGLLDLSKIEAGRWTLRDQPVALRRVAALVLRQQRLLAEQNGLSLTLAVPADLPMLQADEQAVSQMLINLVANAIKFTPRGGSIEIQARRQGGGLVLAVRDTGVGMPPEVQARLFERFTQSADPLVRTERGAGLGLWIVRRLVELHGGRIELRSQPGSGTEVMLHFPAARVVAATQAA